MYRLLCLLTFVFITSTAFSQTTDSLILPEATLYYYSYGTGKPIIILSGGPGIASHQEDDVAIELSKQYQAILFDQRGTGKSVPKKWDTAHINVREAVEDLEALRKHLGLKQLNLLGHSWGSMLAAAYIDRYPKNVSLFISVGGGELDSTLTRAMDETMAMRRLLGDTARYNYWNKKGMQAKADAATKDSVRKLGLIPYIYDQRKMDTVFAQVHHGSRNAMMGNLMWINIARKGKLVHYPAKDFKAPTLLITGWQDPIGVISLHQYRQFIPHAEIKGIHRCGHFPSTEQPQVFFAIVNEFLQKNLK